MSAMLSEKKTAEQLFAQLEVLKDHLGKGGRRVARFIIDQPSAAMVLSAAEVAQSCDVHASSVVRLAQALGLSGYREFQSILQHGLPALVVAQSKLSPGNGVSTLHAAPLRLALLAESGRTFNDSAQNTAERFAHENPSVSFVIETLLPHTVEPVELGERIKKVARSIDGLILVAREHPAINNAVRAVIDAGIPVVCFTSDLPSSPRTAYVGSDQFASGSTAGWLCGRFLHAREEQKVLLVSSVPFRCQLDREQGFRQVLRSEFPLLSIEEKVSSDESPEVVYDAVRRYVAKSGPPAAIYNVSGANLGIARALEADGLKGRTIFIGHELTENTRKLLETGAMDLTIGHDFDGEFAMAVESIRLARSGIQPLSRLTQSQIFTRHNCTAG
ncbi:substrate-binding domain-containing protein [Phaeovulum sp. W22_SRMD_FR3]|uniref:substrate-binding domain-containing protein n=1 Tax=Phaeovulum sp. W22_SRMD_FR3 TaxID=3240274 RepID=UPI003F9D2D9E